MKNIFVLLLIIFVAFQTKAQQVVDYRLSHIDDFLMNPAYVGAYDFYSIASGVEQRFSGISVSPETYYLTFHSRIGKGYLFDKSSKVNSLFQKFGNVALGGQLIGFRFGSQYEYGLSGTFGYHIEFNPHRKTKNSRRLTLAFTPRFYLLGYSDLQFEEDELAELISPNVMIFKSEVSALYRTKFAEIGMSVKNLGSTDNKYEGFNPEEKQTYNAHYAAKGMVNVRGLFENNSGRLLFSPTGTFLSTFDFDASEYFLDLRLDWLAVKSGYRSHRTFNRVLSIQGGINFNHIRQYDPTTIMQPYFGVDFKNFVIKYAYAYSMGEISTQNFGGNHISFQIKLGNDLKEYK